MTIAEALLPEFEQEMATTRRLLERVPTEQGQWKPHPKSFSLGHLTQLVAGRPGWIVSTLRGEDIDLNEGDPYSYEPTEKLVALFDGFVADVKSELSLATDDEFELPWSLKAGGHVLFTQKRREVVRQHINHLVHHRGQLSVYLRLLDIPVPSIYGPTADEKWE
jgi:uncharacterized damage-inducible protein DinB